MDQQIKSWKNKSTDQKNNKSTDQKKVKKIKKLYQQASNENESSDQQC